MIKKPNILFKITLPPKNPTNVFQTNEQTLRKSSKRKISVIETEDLEIIPSKIRVITENNNPNTSTITQSQPKRLDSSNKFFYCSFSGCNLYFVSQELLKRHIEFMHKSMPGYIDSYINAVTQSQIYPCRICKQNFSQVNYLIDHIKSLVCMATPIKEVQIYPCRICKNIFSQANFLNDHIRNKHESSMIKNKANNKTVTTINIVEEETSIKSVYEGTNDEKGDTHVQLPNYDESLEIVQTSEKIETEIEKHERFVQEKEKTKSILASAMANLRDNKIKSSQSEKSTFLAPDQKITDNSNESKMEISHIGASNRIKEETSLDISEFSFENNSEMDQEMKQVRKEELAISTKISQFIPNTENESEDLDDEDKIKIEKDIITNDSNEVPNEVEVNYKKPKEDPEILDFINEVEMKMMEKFKKHHR